MEFSGENELCAMMAALSAGLPPELVEHFAERSGFNSEVSGRPLGREELLARHDASRKAHMPSPPEANTTHVHWACDHSTDYKPAAEFSGPPSISDCTPIHVRSLEVHSPHRRRLLRGTLAVEPFVLSGVHTLLEDELGDLVSVSFYNALPGIPQERRSQFAAAQHVFARGRRLAILEPYYKVGEADSTFLVRVDNPREVVWLDGLGPSPAVNSLSDPRFRGFRYILLPRREAGQPAGNTFRREEVSLYSRYLGDWFRVGI